MSYLSMNIIEEWQQRQGASFLPTKETNILR